MRYPSLTAEKEKSWRWNCLSSGVDWNSADFAVPENRMADCRNLWWEKNALRTRPGLRGSAETRWMTEEPLQYFQESVILSFDVDDRREGWLGIRVEGADMRFQVDVIFTDEDGVSLRLGNSVPVYSSQKPTAMAIPYTAESLLLLISDGSYYRLETPLSETWSSLDREVYYPLAMTDGHGSATPDRSKVTYKAEESYNLLTPYFRSQFTTDEESTHFFLPEDHLESGPSSVTLRWPDGEEETLDFSGVDDRADSNRGWYVFLDRTQGCVYFNKTGVKGEHSVPDTLLGLRNNVEILARKFQENDRQTIAKMRLFTWFGGDRSALRGGGRLFLSGNPDQPHVICWSDSGNPLYFPEDNRAYAGDECQAITAFGKQGKYLIIFKEREIYSVGYAAKSGTSNTAAFPLTQLHTAVGCDQPGTVRLWRGRLTFVCRGRVYWLQSVGTGAAETVRCVSERLGKALAGAEMATLSAGIFRERYLLLCGARIYVLDKEDDEAAVFPWEIGGSSLWWEQCLSSDRQMLLLGAGGSNENAYRLLCHWEEGPDFLPSDENGEFCQTAVCVSFRTGWMPMGEEGNPKFIRRLEWLLSCESPANITGWLSDGRQISRFRSQLKGEALEKWEWYPALSGAQRVCVYLESVDFLALIEGKFRFCTKGECS